MKLPTLRVFKCSTVINFVGAASSDRYPNVELLLWASWVVKKNSEQVRLTSSVSVANPTAKLPGSLPIVLKPRLS